MIIEKKISNHIAVLLLINDTELHIFLLYICGPGNKTQINIVYIMKKVRKMWLKYRSYLKFGYLVISRTPNISFLQKVIERSTNGV